LRYLLLNQCFYPDVVSTAQHLTDLARELSTRGHDVTVLTSDRGYDNPGNRFPRRETWKNISIIRIPSLSLGKETKLKRALNFGSFLTICSLRLLTLRRFDVVVALTSPPLISFLASLFIKLKGGRFCFWVMDLNPDEAIAAGWLRENSVLAGLLKWMLNHSLRTADRTIVLDRFMKDRILEKGIDADRISVLPPWSHDDTVSYSEEGRKAFRASHGLSNKFVVMYSGNHSPCHPLDTLLNAAQALTSRQDVAFCFVGGGSEQIKVREFAEYHRLDNVKCLPYQPLDKLSSSLSAADLHVVVMGDKFVGIVHPCKIYNIQTIGISTLYIGPKESHVSDIAANAAEGQFFMAQHGDNDLLVKRIIEAAEKNARTSDVTSRPKADRFSKHSLLPEMIDLIEFKSANIRSLPKVVAPNSV
jgi:colanic acid biosynthesis glycosyl transferase WcaI